MMHQAPPDQPYTPSPRKMYDLSKRLFDLVVSAASLVLLAPALALIAVLVRIESPGPVLLWTTRLGRWGKPFIAYKFRTMFIEPRADTPGSPREGSGDAVFKVKQDPRVTRVGVFLRKTSMNELPLLINVLRGELSLVGPRPALPYEAEMYPDWVKRRFEVVPGITGLWQVTGRDYTSVDEMIRLDTWYVAHRSFWLDLKILLSTVPLAVLGRGSY